VTEGQKGKEAGPVPQEAKHPVKVQGRWTWTNPAVWTERMLKALEEGVQGGRWYSLMDKVSSPRTLIVGFEAVKANKGAPGIDHQTIEMFEARMEEEVKRLSDELKAGTYRPKAVRRTWIRKPGSAEKRPLGIPTIRDRVVQAALRSVIEPIYEQGFADQSYGFRPERGCKDALRRVDELLKQGHVYVVDADLKGYFDTIPHEPWVGLVEKKIADGKVLHLIQKFLDGEVMDGLERWTPERGSPQGAVISPLLSNIYLDPIDHLMKAEGYEMVRYADDIVVLCRSAEKAQQALETVRRWTEQAGLTLHPTKTHVVNASQRGQGFDFLGYHFERGYRWPREKSLKKLQDSIREKTGRGNGHSLKVIIKSVNRTLRGWLEYFKHSHGSFCALDKWVRMRLRSILRRRHGRKGRGRGLDHQRWTNIFFAAQGLVSLSDSHRRLRQSRAG
jgi:RNA-directed DNA polymerase